VRYSSPCLVSLRRATLLVFASGLLGGSSCSAPAARVGAGVANPAPAPRGNAEPVVRTPEASPVPTSDDAGSAIVAPGPASGPPPASELAGWLKAKLPRGGDLAGGPDGIVSIIHQVQPDDTIAKIADAYLDLTEIYLASDLALTLRKDNGMLSGAEPAPGARLVIPAVVKERWKTADEERLGWPSDKALRGLYVRGTTAGGPLYMKLLARMAERPLNLIVLDTKDYDGLVTYPSKVPLANEVGATKGAPIRDLPRAIRFAHARGIRVAMRISCFEDELVARAKGEMAVQSVWHRPYRIGWLDPANEEAQKYIIDLAEEGMDAGADEIQLDYVRYPVLGIKDADFNLQKRKSTKKKVITEFVHRVHEVTQARGVPLSLDVFGIIAEGQTEDIDNLGQDPVALAKECEALSPMVYPSHFRAGYQGFEVPGNHPEIVGISTRKIIQQLKRGHVKGGAVIRPWLQAASYNSPEYGPPWVANEVRAAEGAGGVGWLMWNPVQTYTVTWNAVPRRKDASRPASESHPAPAPKRR
jgi:hypothetical protein